MGELAKFMEVVVKLLLKQIQVLEDAELATEYKATRIAVLRVAAARAEASIAVAKVSMALRAAGCSEEVVREHKEYSRLQGTRAIDSAGIQEPVGLWDCI